MAACLPELRADARALASLVASSSITLCGSGDSLFAAQALAAFARERDVGPWRVLTPDAAVFEREDKGHAELFVAISFSGTGPRTIEAASVARSRGARILTVTGESEGQLASMADATLPISWRAPSRATPHITDFATTMLALAVLVECASEPLQALDDLPGLVGRSIQSMEPACQQLGADLAAAERCFLLGSGDRSAVARYAAAKIWEAGGWAAWPSDLEEFGHGLHLTARPGDVSIVVASGREANGRIGAVRRALASLGVEVWVISDTRVEPASDRSLLVEAASSSLAPFTLAVPLQWGPLLLAEHRGADLSRPPHGSVDPVPYEQYRSIVADDENARTHLERPDPPRQHMSNNRSCYAPNHPPTRRDDPQPLG